MDKKKKRLSLTIEIHTLSAEEQETLELVMKDERLADRLNRMLEVDVKLYLERIMAAIRIMRAKKKAEWET